MNCNCNNNNFSANDFDTTTRQAVRPIANGCEPIHCPPSQCFCCTGMHAPKFNDSEARSIFANVQQIFDSEVVRGCSINQPVNMTPTGCSILTEFTSCGRNSCCCNEDPCIDEDSCFVVESFSASILDAFPSNMPRANEILINNVPFDGPVNVINRNKFSIPLEDLNPKSLNALCQDDREGSKVAVVVEPCGTTVKFIAEYILCGIVTTSRGAFRFKIVIRNADFETTNHPTNIFTNNICIPFLTCQDTGLMTFDFCYDAQLIAPRLFVDGDDQLRLTGTLIISPTNTIETLIDRKVILNAIEVDRDRDRDCDRDREADRDCDRNCDCDKDRDRCKDHDRDRNRNNNNRNCNCR